MTYVPTHPRHYQYYSAYLTLDTEPDKALFVARMESVCSVIAKAAQDSMPFHQLDVNTAFLWATIGPDDLDVCVIPPEGFACTERQTSEVWKLKAWLH